jgi:hypothetical protein
VVVFWIERTDVGDMDHLGTKRTGQPVHLKAEIERGGEVNYHD